MEDFQPINITSINTNNPLIQPLLSVSGNDLLTSPILFKSSLISEPTIPFIEDGLLLGDANNDGGLSNQDVDLILKDRNKPIVGVNDQRDFDGDGKITIFDVRKLGLFINGNQDKTPPSLSASLANDTGTNADKITADISIIGTVTDASRLTRIRAGLDNTNIANFTNIRGVVGKDGSFVLTPAQLSEINNNTPLGQGQHTLHLFAKDQWNNTSTFDLTFTLDNNSPIINVFLTNDTGISANDKITKDAAITGSINDFSKIVSFKAGFDQTATANFVDVLGTLQGNIFAFDQNKIREIHGGNLSDGLHTLKLIATDIAGNTANFNYTFTLDTIAPQTPGFILDSLFDSAPVGDSITKYAAVTLLGQTDANSSVLLQGSGKSIIADAAGKFTFTNVALTLGDNSFTVIATDTAGNTRSFTDIIKRVTQDKSDVVLDWNTTLLNAIYIGKTAPPHASRNMAITQAAVFDAINSITKTYQNYYFTGDAPDGASPEAAAAAAAHRVLMNVYPTQIGFFDTALTESLAKIPDGTAEDAGVIFGRTVADSILTWRSTDGATNSVNYTPGTNPGDWQPTAPGFAPALLPQWGEVTPFALTSGEQFRPDGPPTLDSQEYANDYNQVKDLGKKDSTTRTEEQTQIALFWADGAGTFTPPGHWNQIAQNVVANKSNSLVDNARIFALLDISLADAGITAWDTKYHYNFWRPITAIRQGDTDGNPNTIADSNWTPLINTPPFPDYISGHSTFSGAASTILTSLLGNNVSFSVNSLGLPGVYRQFDSFTAAADEATISRLYGGIHFNAANVDGLATGKSIGNYVLQNLLAPVTDRQSPIIAVSLLNDTGNSASDRITSDSTIAGTVSDTSQIVKFQAKLNTGSFVDVLSQLNADGSFTFDKAALAQINGGQLVDGVYQLSLKAEDQLGNIASEVKLEFTLDTTKPIVPSQLSIKDSQTTEISDNTPTIIGEAETGIKIEIFNGTTKLGETTAVANKWEITTSQLTDGVKNLTVITTDIAGNISDNQQLIITIDTAQIQQLSVMPGEQLKLELKDIFGKNADFALESQQALPIGTLDSDGTLIFKPAPSQVGTYEFTLLARDGDEVTSKKFKLAVVADTEITTRISGVIQNIAQEPLAGVKVKIGDLSTTTAADGSFNLTLTEPPSNDAALIIEPGQQVNNVVYPSIAEKLPLVLGHDVYANVKNIIDRPIYLPPIDIANAKTINPNVTQIVTSAAIPGSGVTVFANSLFDQQNQPYTGLLSITIVPTELTPAALPENLRPDLVVTIQPGEMVFTTPAPLSLPNLAGYAAGTVMDLWSINPQTGLFDNVGQGRVSADSKVINTISGGIRNSSWHFFAPPAPTPNDPDNDERNPDDGCDECKATASGTSEVELHSGAVIETHNLVAYQSLGVSRGLSLRYDSERADARPILHFGYNNVQANPNLRLMAELTIKRGDFKLEVPGFAGGQFGLNGGEHFWSIPSDGGKIDAALQADLRALASGLYDYDLTTGLMRLNNNQLNGSTSTSQGKFLHINTSNSAFGSGWGLAGLEELIINSDGSVIIIDGDGSELLFAKNVDNSYDSPVGDFSTLERLGDGTFRRTMTDQTVYSFNGENLLSKIRDRIGNETQYFYQNRLLTKMVDPVGLETIFTYSGDKITAITDPAGRVTKLTYDINGNLIKITDPDGTSRTWEYDIDHHMIAEVDQRGNREQTFYDFAGRAKSAIRKDGSELKFDPVQVQGLYAADQTIDPLNAPVAFQLGSATSTYTDANGQQIVNVLDQSGQIVSSSDQVGLLPKTERNEDNLVTRQTDAIGNFTAYTYDAKGNLLSVADDIDGQNIISGAIAKLGEIDEYTFTGKLSNDFQTILTNTGTYLLVLNGNNSNTNINYSFKVTNSLSSTSLTLGTAVSSTISQPGEIDEYTFTGAVGQRLYYAALINNTASTIYARLISPSGQNLFSDDSDGDADRDRTPVTLTEAGTYRLTLNGYNNNTGDYSFNLIDANAPTAMTLGTAVSSTISRPGEIDEYTFTGTVGQRLYYDGLINNATSTIYAYLIYPSDPNGKVILNNEDADSDKTPFTLTESGTYRLILDGLTDNTGDYSFNLINASAATEITLGTTVTDTLTPGLQTHIYQINGTAGQQLYFDSLAANSNATWSLYGPGSQRGNQNINITGNNINLNNDFQLRLTSTGTYLLVVNGKNSNDNINYSFKVTSSLSALTTITLGTVVTDTLTPGLQTDIYEINGIAGQQLYFDSLAAASNATWSLRGPRNENITGNNINLSNDFETTLTSTGAYLLYISGNNSNSNINYSFKVTSSLSSTSLTLGTAITSTISQPGEIDEYTFTGAVGQQLYYDGLINNTTSTIYADLISPSGLTILFNGNRDADSDKTFFTLTESGTYRLILDGLTNNIGNYSFNLIDANAATEIRLGTIVNDTLTPGLQKDIYRINGTAGQKLYFDSLTAAFNAGWSLYGPGNQIVTGSSNLSNDFQTTLTSTGTYLLVLDGNNSNSNINYRFVVYSLETTSIALNLDNVGLSKRLYTYDSKFNQVTSMTDELGHQTLYQIDPNNGNLLSLNQVIGEVGGDDDIITRFTYTNKGLIDLITDPLGRITDSDYDAHGRLISIIYAKGTTDEGKRLFEYDAAGNQTAIINENGSRTQLAYDAQNRLVKIIEADPDGAGPLTSPITNYSYDAAGNLLTTTDALGRVTQNSYDKLNRLTQIIDSLNQKTSYSYDSLGNLLSIVDPLGNKTDNKYDARNRLIETIDPDQGITKFTYDLNNNLNTVTDPVNNKTTFAYDARDRLISETDPLGKTQQYQYDAVNNLIATSDRNNRRIEYKYDDIDRPTTETWVGTDQVIRYSYDKASNQTAVNDKFSSLAFTYDNRDRLLSGNNAGTPGLPSVLLNYTYDKVGNILSVVDTINNVAGGTNSYTYDALNRLTKLTQAGNGVSNKRVDMTYNALGQYTSINRYANLTGTQLVNSTTYTYDSLNRLTNLNHSNGTNNVAFYNYAYDLASRITKITDIDGTTDYTYDDRAQLTGAKVVLIGEMLQFLGR
ncbi:hypothetical protein NIES23_62410 (plasmid) [Trichormus variabilis NIES-23]|uniref:Dockerin domain-containing protein n=1 Tax=Trichormus variabilis NIES-23 TaxID=1973479 RepID=A0A1Z4KX28_ANAVA|nr:hypothetical protein NIES23_62410 [Trichormus variabilis NIES-23]